LAGDGVAVFGVHCGDFSNRIDVAGKGAGSMVSGQKNFHKAFAPVSPVFVLRAMRLLRVVCFGLLAGLMVMAPCFAAGAAPNGFGKISETTEAPPTATEVKRQAASLQYAKAEELRSALNERAAEKRTLAEYKQAVANYHRVTLITPRAPEVPDAILAMAELYTEMGERFGRSYFQSAVDTYEFLAREYPTSKYCQDSLLRAAKLQADQLGDPAAASKTYDAFVKRYPRSPRRREAQEAMAEIALVRNSERGGAPVTVVTPNGARTDASRANGGTSSGTSNVGTANVSQGKNASPATGNYAGSTPPPYGGALPVRESAVRGDAHSGGAQNEDVENPPRVRRIRADSNAGGATRVVIDLEGSVQYSSARISNPERIFFDLHAARLTPEVARGNISVDGRLLTGVRVAQNQAGVVRVVLDVNGVKDYTASMSNNPPQLIIDLYGTAATEAPVRSAKLKRDARMPAPSAEPVPPEDARVNTVPNAVVAHGGSLDLYADATPSVPAAPAATANVQPSAEGSSSAATAPVLTEKSQRAKPLKATNASSKPDLVRPVTAAPATHDGQATLTRTLGLKIGRIVIDAGHGGHDTGTIGPTGLMEKDLCLDVALRLGKIVQQKLPGADVVYTRSDDTFIPLEERTNIANQAKADLFISIHANSSQDHAARGIETYYLNLRGTPEAMEVAARENATSQQGIHDLQDVVRQIARTEKIDESKEFAEDVQNSLSSKIQKSAKTVKNRGVRKAPFVVLIGADMPSILTEISFLSNPADEKLLKQPDQRQHVAEGIFAGVSSYLESLNSVAFNQSGRAARPHAAPPAVEQSANQK
jgi:N-acetylmuramoyl-L-alanine amidase